MRSLIVLLALLFLQACLPPGSGEDRPSGAVLRPTRTITLPSRLAPFYAQKKLPRPPEYLEVGQVLAVEMPENASTGFVLQHHIDKGDLLELSGSDHESDPGGDGWMVWE